MTKFDLCVSVISDQSIAAFHMEVRHGSGCTGQFVMRGNKTFEVWTYPHVHRNNA